MLVADIHHVSLNVSDLDRSTAFYRDVLGLSVLPRPEMPVQGVWLDAGNDQQVHLILADVPDDRGQHVAFRVDDLDGVIGSFRELGLTISRPFPVADTGIRQAFASDPDGNRLEFTQTA